MLMLSLNAEKTTQKYKTKRELQGGGGFFCFFLIK